MRRPSRSFFLRYSVAVLSIALATGLRLLLNPVLVDRFPFATLFFAVLFAAWYGGLGPALVATLLGAVASALLLRPSPESVILSEATFQSGLALYVVVGLGIAALGGAMRAARERAEEAAESAARQREELRTTLASIGDAVLVTDVTGRVVSLNAVAEGLTGWRSDDARGRPLEEVFHIVNERTRQPVEAPVAQVLREGGIVGLANHTVLIARDGREVPIDDSAAPIRTGEQIVGVVLVFRDVTDRKQAEQVVREQAEVLTGILDASVDHIYVVGRDGRYRHVSAGGARVLGFEPGRMAGRHWRELGLTAEVMEPFDAQRDDVLRAGKASVQESAFVTPGGDERHFEYVVAPIAGRDGPPDAVVVISRDVTERRRAEQDLLLQARVLESMAEGVRLSDEAGFIRFTNPAEDRMFGYERGELIGQPVTALNAYSPEENRRLVAAVVEQLRQHGVWTGEWLNRRKDGTPFFTFARINVLQMNDQRYWVCVQEDVTARKAAEAALREAEARFAAVINHTPACVFAKDRDGRYLLANRALAALLGRRPEDFPGRTDRDFFPPEVAEQFGRDDAAIIETGQPRTYEESFSHGGVTRTYLTVKFPLRDEAGEAFAACAVATEVTGLKRAEAELQATAGRLNLALAAARLGDWSWVEATDHVTLSERAAELFGIPTGQRLTWTAMQEMLHADDRERVRQEVIRAVANRTPYDTEYRVNRPDGTQVWVAALGRAHYDPDGRPLGMYGVVQDVTARREAEEEAREEARTTETLHRIGKALSAQLDLKQIVQIVTDESTVLTTARFGAFFYNLLNDRGESYTLYTISGVPREAFDRFPMPRNTAIFEPTFRGTGVVRLDDVTRDPRYGQNAPHQGMPEGHLPVRSYLAVPVLSRSGEVLGGLFFGHPDAGVFSLRHERLVVGIATQAAVAIDNARLYAQVRDSEGRFRGLMEQAPFSVQIFAPDGRTLRVNRAWEELWGITLEQVADYNVLHDPQLEAKGVLPLLRRAFAGEAVAIPEIKYDPEETIPDRTRHREPSRWVAAVAYPLKDDAEQVREVVLVHEDRTARMRAEAALRESELTLRAFYDNSPVCMGVTEPTADGDILHLYDNPASCRFFGVEPGTTAGKRALTELGAEPAAVVRWLACYRESQATGRPVRFDHEYRGPDGTRWLSATVCPVGLGPSGRPRFCYVAADVTERRRQEEKVRQSEERLRLALDAGRMGVWDWDVRSNELRWSDTLEPIHGLAPGSFPGTLEAFQQLIHPDDLERVQQAIARCLRDQSSYDIEFRIVWPDGSVHWMAGKGKVFTGDDGRPARMIGVGLDVTGRKRAEQDMRFLADASATLAALVDYQSTLQKVARLAVPDFADWCAVDMLDDGGSLRRLAVAHVDPAKVELAHELHRRYPPDPAAPQGAWHIVRTGRPEIIPEITDDLLGGTIREPERLRIARELGLRSYLGVPLSVRGRTLGVITFIGAESGRRYTASDLAVAEDLANRASVAIDNARLYQEVQEADRRKDEFLAVLAHELRNPLAPIRNAVQVLKLAGGSNDMVAQARDMAERQVHHLTRLVDDLLDVSRIMRGKVELRRERVELATAIARAVETARPVIDAERHELTVSVSEQPVCVDADLVRLSQVVSNLLNNAAKYTEKGGRVWLSAGMEDGEAVVRVRDTGIGIPPDMLPRIFDMFMQVAPTADRSKIGLGIGLTLVKNLVELHGGTVEAHSGGQYQGSEFVVRLPLAESQLSSTGPEEQPAAVPMRRVLVVDDNVDAADSLAILLRLQGQEVEVAYDGASALELAGRSPPGVAFLDLGMPAMDGYELARRFRTTPELTGVLLVALTGWGQPEDRARTREAGFDHHLVKPVEPDALTDVLRHPRLSGPA